MKITDVFCWRDSEEISIDELKQIFIDFYVNKKCNDEFVIEKETPENSNSNVISCTEDMKAEGKNVAYVISKKEVIALISYFE